MRTFLLHKFGFAALAASFVGLAAVNAYAARQDFDVINHSGREIAEVHVSTTSNPEIGPDLLDDYLPNGYREHVSLPDGLKPCRYDLTFIFSDGGRLMDADVNLCRIDWVAVN